MGSGNVSASRRCLSTESGAQVRRRSLLRIAFGTREALFSFAPIVDHFRRFNWVRKDGLWWVSVFAQSDEPGFFVWLRNNGFAILVRGDNFQFAMRTFEWNWYADGSLGGSMVLIEFLSLDWINWTKLKMGDETMKGNRGFGDWH